ncbi:unnamed protein product [Urochloa decumbens]|uniref:Coenzyme Q-binding protein COQ10 START domain-containing protein n=1 Tax=Urochloa decumbens TaxID=240449 RepID=A0ABC9H1H5_9POAL
MACPATCCCASSLRSVAGSRPARLIFRSAPCRTPIIPRVRLSLSAAAAGGGGGGSSSSEPQSPPPAEEEEEEEREEGIGLEIEVSKAGTKRNRRVVRARVRVDAPLEAVWATLTDYEGLADFIPGLAECRLLERDSSQGFARLYQVGEQDLALGFKFNAKGTIDCYEGDMESLPVPGEGARSRRREIAFNMIDGDFKLFQGKWSLLQEHHHQATTLLSYLVELEPKLWVPVRLLEGRICTEIKNNLVSIRQQAQRRTTLHKE